MDLVQQDWYPCNKKRLGHREEQRDNHVKTQGDGERPEETNPTHA